MRTLVGLFTCSLPDVQLEAARCLHELSHSSDAAVAEACVPVTSYLLTYLSGHSVELMVRSMRALPSLTPSKPPSFGQLEPAVAHMEVLVKRDSLEVSVPTFSVEQDCLQCWPSCGFAWPSLGTHECGDPCPKNFVSIMFMPSG